MGLSLGLGFKVPGPLSLVALGKSQLTPRLFALPRACDKGASLIPNLQQRELRLREGKLFTGGHTGVTEQQVLKPNPSLPGGCFLLQEAPPLVTPP